MGRPKLNIPEEQVEKLAMIGCTEIEIAFFFDCSRDTIHDRFSDVIKRGMGKGNITLRKAQFDKAKEGNITMLIWLGKQRLGQADKMISMNENHVEYKGAVIAAPNYTDEEKKAYEKYRRMAMGDN